MVVGGKWRDAENGLDKGCLKAFVLVSQGSMTSINPTSAAAPFGGMKESGMGRDGSSEGINEYLETKLVGLSV